uniref:Meiosis initiator n=1 Tax=Neovison vison TaxID=452646 RepID=A0A8C7ASV8_NEOVI
MGGLGVRCQHPNQHQLLAPNRRQRKNHTSKLHELALLLPVALKTGTKKLTKKEILLHVLHYIQHLQRSIDVAKTLLKFHTTNGEGGLRGPARRRHSTPSSSPHSRKSRLQGACRKPRKKKPTGLSGMSEAEQEAKSRGREVPSPEPFSLQSSPDTFHRTPPSTPLPAASTERPQQVTPRHAGDNSWAWGHRAVPGPGLQICLSNSISHRQKLVFYDSSEDLDKESPDADPWLPAWTPEGSPPGSPLALGPPQINSCTMSGHPSAILGLSPSLFSSPGKLLPEQILGDGTEFLTQGLSAPATARSPSPTALFEDVFLDPESSPTDGVLCQSSVSLDHCYLSLSENSKAPSGSSSSWEGSEAELVWRRQEANPKGPPSSSDEDGDYTWTPTRRAASLPAAGRKVRKGPAKPKENKKASCPTQTKKKCVNGFIMFCRMNRKQYIRACPGTASTAATKELAQLWRVMTQQERRPYCIKARRFSLQHNRIVKQDSSSSEDEDWGTPKPFYQLLAEKARRSPDLAPLLPPQHH